MINNKRILIVTGGDRRVKPILELTLPSKVRYAQMHGYDFLCLNSFQNYDDFQVDGSDIIGLGFSRTLQLMSMMDSYDLIAWLDSDSIITNPNIKIEDIANTNHTLFFSYDWCVAADLSTSNKNFSAGNFIIKKTEFITSIINSFAHSINAFLHDTGSDQALFNALYSSDQIKEHICLLDHRYLNAVPEFVMRTTAWSSDPRRGKPNFRIESPWNEDCFIAHLTGCTNDDRISLLQNELKNYL